MQQLHCALVIVYAITLHSWAAATPGKGNKKYKPYKPSGGHSGGWNDDQR